MPTTSKLALGEPLLTDRRLEKVAGRLVVEFPKLLDYETDFVTWIQEPQELLVEGLVRKLPRVAVLGMVSPNPKHPDSSQLSKAGMWYDHWREEDQMFGRMNQKDDPALKFYRVLAKEHLRLMDNLTALRD